MGAGIFAQQSEADSQKKSRVNTTDEFGNETSGGKSGAEIRNDCRRPAQWEVNR